MRLKAPRVEPLPDGQLSAEIKDMLGPRFRGIPVPNIFRTLAKAPKAYKRFMVWGGYILSDANDLRPRQRELVILRVGYLLKSGYEWAQHVRIGTDCGLTNSEIEQIKLGPEATGWDPEDRSLLKAADQLINDAFVSEATWAELSWLTEKQKMDLVMTVAQYTQVSMMLNTFGVQLDDDLELDPDLCRW